MKIPTMGFFDIPLPKTYEAYCKQANWIAELRKQADELGQPKETIQMLDNLYYIWIQKATRILKESK